MKASEYFNTEDKPIVSLEKARELLKESELTEEELQKVLLNIQQFCEMTYDLYLMKLKATEKIDDDDYQENYSMAA